MWGTRLTMYFTTLLYAILHHKVSNIWSINYFAEIARICTCLVYMIKCSLSICTYEMHKYIWSEIIVWIPLEIHLWNACDKKLKIWWYRQSINFVVYILLCDAHTCNTICSTHLQINTKTHYSYILLLCVYCMQYACVYVVCTWYVRRLKHSARSARGIRKKISPNLWGLLYQNVRRELLFLTRSII